MVTMKLQQYILPMEKAWLRREESCKSPTAQPTLLIHSTKTAFQREPSNHLNGDAVTGYLLTPGKLASSAGDNILVGFRPTKAI